MIFLIIVSVIVANVLLLTVFARSKEISIRNTLERRDWFVRDPPFLFEGIASICVGDDFNCFNVLLYIRDSSGVWTRYHEDVISAGSSNRIPDLT